MEAAGAVNTVVYHAWSMALAEKSEKAQGSGGGEECSEKQRMRDGRRWQ